MKEELTREVVEAMSMCSHNVGCKKCAALYFCNGKMWPERCKRFAAALLDEMDKPKVWDGAPEDAPQAEDALNVQVTWFTKNSGYIGMKTYTRELPKTCARLIAEEIASAKISNKKDLVDIIEQTINTHMKELKGKE